MAPASSDDAPKRKSRAKATPLASSELWASIEAASAKDAAEERHPPEYLALLEKRKDWKELTRRLVLWIYMRIRKSSMHDAEDLAQTTLLLVFEPSRMRWDPAVQPDLFRFLTGLARSVIANWWRTSKRHPERAYTHETLVLLEDRGKVIAGHSRSTEDELSLRQHAALAIKELEARIRDDIGCREILTLMREGVDDREEQMKILKKPLEYVKNARRRLSNHLDIVLAELEEEGTDRRV